MNRSTHIAGGPQDFMTVRHLVVGGTQREIGRAMAEEVRSTWTPPRIDPMLARARRTWFARNWPQHHARAAGIADVHGADPGDALDFDGLTALPAGSGCSAAWVPPSTAVDGRGRLGRNYDFFTLGLDDMFSGTPSGAPPWASRPYVVTTVPDDGLASTVLTMAYLDGCSEGVNEAGLAVVLLAADIPTDMGAGAPEPPPGPQAGLGVMQVPRFLLDTCENAAQAKEALLGAKQYAQGLGCHYLIADASGDAFVWERGAGDTEHILPATTGPLCVTNHPLHRHRDVAALPEDTDLTFRTYERLRTLTKRAPASADELRSALDEVMFGAVPGFPWRTLWRTVIDPRDRTMTTRFYLGDGETEPRYTPETVFGVAGR